MATFHPTFGELLTAKEVIQLTGFTMNQLRNWRIPARRELAPFGFVSIGVSPHYRKVVVEAWLERNGGSNVSYSPAGLDAEFPIGEGMQVSLEQRSATDVLSKITTETVFHWLSKKLDEKVSFINTWKEFWALTGKPYISSNEKATNFDWYEGATMTHRLFVNDAQGLGLSVDQILAIPVGAVPPVREKR